MVFELKKSQHKKRHWNTLYKNNINVLQNLSRTDSNPVDSVRVAVLFRVANKTWRRRKRFSYFKSHFRFSLFYFKFNYADFVKLTKNDFKWLFVFWTIWNFGFWRILGNNLPNDKHKKVSFWRLDSKEYW